MTAPRHLLRVCCGSARGAWQVACLCLALLGLATISAAQVISDASYMEPTSEYPHGVLGDSLEWKELSLTVTGSSGEGGVTYQMRAPENMVYEDISPRLWDVTGDGAPEVVVVQSHQQKGARLVIIGLNDVGKPDILAATGHIGTRFRWLAPVGAADFDGDGHIEIGFVDRPHLAKTLQVWRYTENSFDPIANLAGVTNHRIGEDFISGGIRDCGEGPEMILADARWANIVAVRLNQSGLDGTRIAQFKGPASFDTTLNCQ